MWLKLTDIKILGSFVQVLKIDGLFISLSYILQNVDTYRVVWRMSISISTFHVCKWCLSLLHMLSDVVKYIKSMYSLQTLYSLQFLSMSDDFAIGIQHVTWVNEILTFVSIIFHCETKMKKYSHSFLPGVIKIGKNPSNCFDMTFGYEALETQNM